MTRSSSEIPTRPPQAYKTRSDFLNKRELCHMAAERTPGGQPWPTVVLGSGCTTSTAQVNALFETADRLKTVVSERFEDKDLEGQAFADVVDKFAVDLICDRLRLPRNRPPGEGSAQPPDEKTSKTAGEVPDWLADLFVVGALLTNFYFEVKAAECAAPRRPDHEDEAVLEVSEESEKTDKLIGVNVTRSKQILGDLLGSEGPIARKLSGQLAGKDKPADEDCEPLRRTIHALIDRLQRGLETRDGMISLSLFHVQSLAEFAWFCLTTIAVDKDGAPVYPGWTDLLMDLSNYELVGHGPRAIDELLRTMESARDIIRSRYRHITNISWEKRHGNHQFYESVARLLSTEGAHYAPRRENTDRSPIPTAFVTSFDVELEIALLRLARARAGAASRRADRRSFTVVIPVRLLYELESTRVTQTCWVALKVSPLEHRVADQALANGLLDPPEGNWSLLDWNDPPGEPFVVHLAGCPLIQLPDLTKAAPLRKALLARYDQAFDDLANAMVTRTMKPSAPDLLEKRIERKKGIIRNSLTLEHAVVINEHDAMQHNESDLLQGLLSELLSQDDSQGFEAIRSGLPASMATSPPDGDWTRYWLLLGVQIRDSAVRQRVATLVSSIPRSVSTSGDANLGTGLAVNAHITRLEQNLLLWNEFDVIREQNVASFSTDLQHLEAHLRLHKSFFSGRCDVRD